MPWAMPRRPSLAIGLIHSVLRENGLPVVSRCAYLDFLEFVTNRSIATGSPRLNIEDYEHIASQHYLGEWIFSGPPFFERPWGDDSYLEYLLDRNFPGDLIEVAREFRRCVPEFVEHCAQMLLSFEPSAVGFSTTLSQTIPSLIVSKRLKQLSPELPIVFGGANCEGDMGRAMFASFEWIDAIVQGEAENSVSQLFRDLIAGGPVSVVSGVLARSQKKLTTIAEGIGRPFKSLDDLPIPNYDDYFAALADHPLGAELSETASIPIETSRGCWWGAKHHCTFCGLNGETMAFRSKSAPRAEVEYLQLAERYQIKRFEASDNILDMSYLRSLLPQLSDKGLGLSLFYEVKINFSKEQLRTLASAGVYGVQPGIESLSSSILRLMRKGSTALQNIRLLKWCAEFGIHPDWNVIFGFPGEDQSEYSRMAELVPSLYHLVPPSWTLLALERFSPYHQTPEAFGLRILGPNAFYKFSYPCDDLVLAQLAHSFQYEHLDGREPVKYAEPLRRAILRWSDYHFAHSDQRPLLAVSTDGDQLVIRDRRFDGRERVFHLDRTRAAVYQACDSGATVGTIGKNLRDSDGTLKSAEEIVAVLEELVYERLVYQEEHHFLSLGIPTDQSHCAS